MSEAYNKAWEKFCDEMGENTPDLEVEFGASWRACKEEVLKILKKDWTGLDLSINSCDNYYIEKIEKL